MITVWVLGNAEKEITDTGYRPEINAMLATLARDGQVPSAWFHRETEDFDALGPPRTTVRVYYAKHANQIIVLHAASGKHGKGKLPANTKRTVEQRLHNWKTTYPKGRADSEEKK